VYTTIYIHAPKKKRTKLKPSGKKDTFVRYKVYHMEIDCKEKKAPKMTEQIPLVHMITLQIIKKS
jgi:hypothetical protein